MRFSPPPGEESEDIEYDAEEGKDYFELLIFFPFDGSLYGLYIPLDDFFIIARMTGDGEGVVLTEEEAEPIKPIIEAELDRREQDT